MDDFVKLMQGLYYYTLLGYTEFVKKNPLPVKGKYLALKEDFAADLKEAFNKTINSLNTESDIINAVGRQFPKNKELMKQYLLEFTSNIKKVDFADKFLEILNKRIKQKKLTSNLIIKGLYY